MRNDLSRATAMLGAILVVANLGLAVFRISEHSAERNARERREEELRTRVDAVAAIADESERRLVGWMQAARAADSASPARTREPEPSNARDALDLAARVEALEVAASGATWRRITSWGDSHLGSRTPPRPEPASPEEVARATKLDCLTTLAFRDPGSPHFQEAVAALQRELKSSELPMRVRALIELRRLGPQRRLDSGVLVRTDENVTANGGVCVPDDAIADLIEAGRRVPDLRSELLQNLDQVLAPDVRDFAVESLRDPQRSVRRQAVDLLGEFPPSVERRRAAEDALNDEDDPAIRSLLRKLR